MDEIKSGLMSYSSSGRVAQLDRALASEAKGRGFESRLAHQCRTFSSGGRSTILGLLFV